MRIVNRKLSLISQGLSFKNCLVAAALKDRFTQDPYSIPMVVTGENPARLKNLLNGMGVETEYRETNKKNFYDFKRV